MTASRKGLPYVIKSQQSERPLLSRRTPPLEKVCLGGHIHVIDGKWEKEDAFRRKKSTWNILLHFAVLVSKGSQLLLPTFDLIISD